MDHFIFPISLLIIRTHLLPSGGSSLFTYGMEQFQFGRGDNNYERGSIYEMQMRDDKYLKATRSLPKSAQLPMNVSVTMTLESISDIQTTYAVIDLYMSEFWNAGEIHDTSYKGAKNTSTKRNKIKLSGEGSQAYTWTTDTYFLLAKHVKYYTEAQYLVLERDGFVHRDRKIRIEAPCTLTVLYFPFDNSQCRILLSSYGFHTEELRLRWSPDAVIFPYQYDSLKELGFIMNGIEVLSYEAPYGPVAYDILEAQLNFTRLSSVYLYQVYIPAASLVVMSWVPFWLTEEKCGTPARASIGVMTVLSMLTICSNVKNVGGAVSRNVSLLDIWMWVSFGLVVLAMLQFAMADFHRTDDRVIFLGVGRRHKDMTKRKIDRVARIVFPLTYFIFNAGYWIYVEYIKALAKKTTVTES
ncbi:gamma-aminobutyric acid receptor subunit beta-like [Convolutriloba macropyga]|uniref:gamma-aminobutyric acid receptor subunit beta-like n=1 Tax=Convolutriloba macropyga TaxID=536237 RepID=UPI003F522A33